MTFQYPSVEFPPPHLSLFPASRLVATSMAHRAMRHPDSPQHSNEKRDFWGGMVSLHWCHYSGGKPIISRIFSGFSWVFMQRFGIYRLVDKDCRKDFLSLGFSCYDSSLQLFSAVEPQNPTGLFYTFMPFTAATPRSTEFSKGSR